MYGRIGVLAMVACLTAAGQDMVTAAVAGQAARDLAVRVAELRKKGPSEELARTLNEVGVLAFRSGKDADAVAKLKESIALWAQVAAPDNPGRVTATVNLARVHAAIGRIDQAERALQEMRALLEAKPHDVRYATVLNNLALVAEERGEGDKAEALYREATALFERAGPAMDAQRGATLNNLASRLLGKGQVEPAREAAVLSLALLERSLGAGDPDTAMTIHTLAMIDHVDGQAEAAVAGYERALRICVQALGESHPGVALVESSLASLLMEQGYYGKAEPVFERALATRERMLGPDHPQTATTLAGLGTLRARQGRFTEAERLLTRALRIMDAHPTGQQRLLSVLGNLAGVELAGAARDKRKYALAETHLRRLLALHEKLDGADDIRLAPVLDRLADTCTAQRKHREAARIAERALAIRRVALGERHPDTAANLRRYSTLLRKQ